MTSNVLEQIYITFWKLLNSNLFVILVGINVTKFHRDMKKQNNRKFMQTWCLRQNIVTSREIWFLATL